MKTLLIIFIISLEILVQAFILPHDKVTNTEQQMSNIHALVVLGSETNDESKCLKSCVMKNLNLLTPENKLNKDAVLEFVREITNDKVILEAAENVTGICNEKINEKDPCEAANKYSACFMEMMNKLHESSIKKYSTQN